MARVEPFGCAGRVMSSNLSSRVTTWRAAGRRLVDQPSDRQRSLGGPVAS
ncbi:hypothetical protein BZL30_3610 [Mycobacterium kansasii]|uniref:Uncharacterized protein n=1 Tax=Mycobacterium kansasii TaxID=1768 RepID=A0A1V3X8J1_MYCKA|nr:hypothetical protein BZL30_3610 [Mycobacterium kansasii]